MNDREMLRQKQLLKLMKDSKDLPQVLEVTFAYLQGYYAGIEKATAQKEG